VTLYLFDDQTSECRAYTRNEATGLINVWYEDTLPEHFYEHAEPGVFLVFDGIVHRDTQDATDEELEARGLPTSARHHSEWWVGSMKPASDAELLALFSHNPVVRSQMEGLEHPPKEGPRDDA